jgi:superfamily II DNA or RNA helicase
MLYFGLNAAAVLHTPMPSSAPSATTSIPSQGQLVDVRGRRFVVNSVTRTELPAQAGTLARTHHLLALTSIEDDALGEELQVVWEVEPGARAYEESALPPVDGFDPPARLRAFLNAVRWGAASLADAETLHAPFHSGIDIEDYQLEPLVRALPMLRVSLLIADDVGLGKTIEAGLVAQELILRHRARRVLVVCPAALQIQWRDQMREKFGLEFRIVDGELMRQLRRERGVRANPWTHFPRLITSIDYLKRDGPRRFFQEALPGPGELPYPRRFDLLIVDEAHHIAPSGGGRYAVDSDRTRAIRMLAPHFEHKLFLTATPHNGYAESFAALLELLDNQRFARGIPPDRATLARVMVRRLKSEMKDSFEVATFPPRSIETLAVDLSDDDRAAHRALSTYTRLRLTDATEATERTATEFVVKLLKKRMLSSPAAFARTIAQHRTTLAGLMRGEAASTLTKGRAGILRAMADDLDEEFGDDDTFEATTDEAVRALTPFFRPPTAEETGLLDAMQDWAERAVRRTDGKARALIAWLREVVCPNGQWTNERVIIFTEYRDTQKWLHGQLAAEGLAGDRLMTLYGGMPDDDRERIKAAFQASPSASPVRILLATDAASEGIDLQRHCHRLVHYEIPWNPNRMEQRNGRIDRHGQAQASLIYHFVPRGFAETAFDDEVRANDLDGELEFLVRAARKVEQIREDLGKVGPVIAEQVTDVLLGKRRRLDTAGAEQTGRAVREQLRFAEDLNRRLKELSQRLHETRRELQLGPEAIRAAVMIALELAGQPPLREANLRGIWPDQSGTQAVCPVFHMPPLRGSWAECLVGLEHPHTRAVRPVTFDHAVAKGRDDIVLVHLNHRLVQMALRLLRAEIWAGDGRKLNRVAAQVVPDSVAPLPAVIAYGRLVVIGGDRYRLHEEIVTAGGEILDRSLEPSRFRRLSAERVTELLGALSGRDVPEAAKTWLREKVWPDLRAPLETALAERREVRERQLSRELERRREREARDMEAVLRELERTIRAQVEAGPRYEQLTLFSAGEREQYDRDLDALRMRLAQIPAEIDRETAAIRDRFRSVQARLFPVALLFCIPERMVR